jgi:hypothetical protein
MRKIECQAQSAQNVKKKNADPPILCIAECASVEIQRRTRRVNDDLWTLNLEPYFDRRASAREAALRVSSAAPKSVDATRYHAIA